MGRLIGAVASASRIALASLAAACAVLTALFLISIVWTDLLHANPGRTLWEAFGTALISPLFGAVFGVLWFAAPIAAGSALGGVILSARGRLSFMGCAAVVALGTSAFACSWVTQSPAVDDVSGQILDGPSWSTLAVWSSVLAVSLCAGCRLCDSRAAARRAHGDA